MAEVQQQDVASFEGDATMGFNPCGLPGIGNDPPASAQRRHVALAHAIETVVIPRLVRTHRAAATPGFAAAAAAGVLTADSVRDFARLMLTSEVPTAATYLAEMRARGTALETLYLDLLAPAARYLGELWKEDLCDFTQVTTGLWRLQQVLRELGAAFHDEVVGLDPNRYILLVPAPGEQHTFGMTMVAEFFRRAGWGVWSGTPDSMAELLSMVRGEWFAVIGLSVACGSRVDSLAGAIRDVRRASRNRDIGVMVGGPLFVEHPDLVAQVGADATAADGRQAVLNAAALLDRLSLAQLAGSRAIART